MMYNSLRPGWQLVDEMKFSATTRAISLLLLLAAASFGQTAQPQKKKIIISGLPDSAIAELRKSAPPNVLIVSPPPDQIASEIADADALISTQLTRAELNAAKQLKWIHIMNSGVENIAPALKGTDITLTNLKVVLGPEVADHAMALLLSLTRGLNETIPARGKWEMPRNLAQLTELDGKTAVIIGVGGVGTQIAQRASAFGMTIIGVDPKDAAPLPVISRMVKPSELDAVLPLADVVFVTVPETPATKGMIGPAQFREMKRGAYFIAVSRGTIYSTDALVEALSTRRLAGAGLDVTDPEPLPANHPLWKFENVVITPHIAGASDVSLTRILDLVRENIRRFASGEPLLNTIDKDKGY
jgi:phosphoglycerate dehydrogenase-like enzyme